MNLIQSNKAHKRLILEEKNEQEYHTRIVFLLADSVKLGAKVSFGVDVCDKFTISLNSEYHHISLRYDSSNITFLQLINAELWIEGLKKRTS